MRKNSTGLTILETGDVVRIGKGKVLYTVVASASNGTVGLESHNTEKRSLVEEGRVTLVRNVRNLPEVAGSVQVAGEPGQVVKAEAPVKENTSYQKAVLLALNALGKHVYAGTVSETKKAKTRKLNGRQKTSRKANR